MPCRVWTWLLIVYASCGCRGLTTEEALMYIGQGQHATMLQLHDSLTEQKRTRMAFHNFEEPPMAPGEYTHTRTHAVVCCLFVACGLSNTGPLARPDFYPTYKKFDQHKKPDYSTHAWVNTVYHVHYKDYFYKGGKTKDRVPR